MIDPLVPYEPSAQDPFDLRKVGHLLRRAGHGATLAVRRSLVSAGIDAAIDHVMPPLADVKGTDEHLQDVIAFGEIERVRAFRVWLALRSAHPLRERMAQFWHGHFATSNQKVLDPRAMALQFAVFDQLGLDRFDELLMAMCRDPALLRWLDNDVNTKLQPNENFARELFELFTLGRGNYSEADIRAAARAFSGWHVSDGHFHFAAHLHDAGEKTLFGNTGPFDGADVARLCVERRESALFMARKWLQYFVNPEPDAIEVESLARVYEQCQRNIGRTLRTLLRSRLFFSSHSVRSKVKSPAEFVIGTVRLLGGKAQPTWLARVMSSLGEAWCEPPSVEGWHGERAWMSPASWLLRSNFVADLLSDRRGAFAPQPARLFGDLQRPEDRCKLAILMLLDGQVSDDRRESLRALCAAQDRDAVANARELLHAVACTPEYQLS